MDGYCILVLIFINRIAFSKGTVTVTDPSGRDAVTLQGTLTLRCSVSLLQNYVGWGTPPSAGGPICLCSHTSNSCFTGSYYDSRVNCTSDISKRLFTLTITNMTIRDEGNYTCLHTIEGKVEQASLVISYQVPITSVDVTRPSSSLVTVTENLPSTFVCDTSAGRPQATITWYKQLETNAAVPVPGGNIITIQNGTLVITRSTLQLTPTRTDHAYKLYCTAYNSDASSTKTSTNKPQFYVQYAPDSVPVIEGQTSYSAFYIVDGTPQRLTCSVDGGRPLASLSWNCFNGAVQDESTGTTTVKKVTWTAARAHGGQQCTCQALHPVWTSSRAVFVTIEALYPPTSPTFTVQSQPVSGATVSVIEGNSVSVTCSSTSNPPPVYSWNPRGSPSNSDILPLTSVSTSNNGDVYTCTATNTMTPTQGDQERGFKSAFISLNVLYPPIIFNLTNETAVENSTFSKNCLVTPGNPETTDGKWARVKDNTVFNGQMLTIGKVTRGDAGTYRCTSNNTMQPTGETDVYGTDSTTFTLIVYYSASIAEFTINGAKGDGPFTYNENTRVTIVCMVDSNPGSEISISKDGSEMSKVTNRRDTTHTIEEASCLDAGLYLCTARNQYNGNIYSTISRQVYFRCPPRPLDSVNNYTYYYALNDTVTLKLTVTAYPEPASYRWFKQGIEITSGVSRIPLGVSKNSHQTNLTLEQITQYDLGQYKIVVTNNQGTLEHLFFVAAQDKPQKPTNVTSEPISHNSALIQWVPGFNGGQEQTFFVEYWPSSQNNVTAVQQKRDQGESPLNITLTELIPVTQYTVQVYGGNSIGNSTKSLQTTFTTKRTPYEDPRRSAQSSIIIAGVFGGLAACLIVVVIIILRIRKGSLRCMTNDSNTEQEQQDEIYSNHVYVNTTANPDTMGPKDNIDRNKYEELNMADLQPRLYEQLQHGEYETRDQDTDNRNAYETLDNASVNPQLYDSLQHTSDHLTETSKVYENLRLS